MAKSKASTGELGGLNRLAGILKTGRHLREDKVGKPG
jgi:hypothetical protein